MNIEQRRHPRFLCTGTAEVYPAPLQKPYLAKIINVSIEGCRLVLQDPPEIAKDSVVEIVFNVNQLPFRVRGQVKAVMSRRTLGLAFVKLSERSTLNLRDLICELAEKQPCLR